MDYRIDFSSLKTTVVSPVDNIHSMKRILRVLLERCGDGFDTKIPLYVAVWRDVAPEYDMIKVRSVDYREDLWCLYCTFNHSYVVFVAKRYVQSRQVYADIDYIVEGRFRDGEQAMLELLI